MSSVVILGGNALNKGVVDYFKTLDLRVIVIDYRDNIDLECDYHLKYDAKDPNVINILKEKGINDIKVVYTSMDNAGLAQAAICKYSRLLHAEDEAIKNAHYKNLMHKKWEECELLNRRSFALQYFDLDKIKELNSVCKIIIKPVNACASRGITIIEKLSSDEVLSKAFEEAVKYSTDGLVNVEEFVEGTEFTVEMLGDNFGNVSVFGVSKKYHTENIDNNKVAIKLHYNPEDVPESILTNLAEFGIKCYKALGLKNCLGHLEVLMKANGEFSPVEIGSRSSGYIASNLAQAGTGLIYLEEFIKVLNGSKVENGYLVHNNESAMYFFYDIPGDKLAVKDSDITKFLGNDISSLYNDRKNLKKGTFYKKLTQDTDRYGYEILLGPKERLTIKAVLNAEKEFLKDLLGE